MRVIYKDSKQTIEKDYPTNIENAVYKLDSSIQYYYINELKPDNPNSNRYDLVKEDILTEENHPEYKHLKICNRVWKLVEKDSSIVIQNLNEKYGNYLDEQYPQIVRLNHLIEKQLGTNDERLKYIESLQLWLIDCKLDRELRIIKYLENNIFPDFENFNIKPQKSK
jgi:hypothetical protein